MKRKYLFLAAIVLIAGLQVMAQQKITFTWSGSTSPKKIYIQATSGTGNISVDWGDGNSAEPYNGRGDGSEVWLTSPAYSNTNDYNVTITADAGTDLTYLECYLVGVSTLDISNAPKLTILYCSGNPLTDLDVSANTALKILSCSDNQLTDLNVSTNTVLTTLDCSGNQLTSLNVSANVGLMALACSENYLTSLDVSSNTALISLECPDNQLTSLDLSANVGLIRLLCYNNQLTDLDLSSNTALVSLECSSNAIPLIGLKNITDNTTNIPQTSKFLGTQTLATQTWTSATAVIDSVFGGTSGGTEFVVKLDGASATAADYSITDGEITFKQSGLYEIEISNPTELVSHPALPAKVITSYQVTLPVLSTDATLSGLTVSAGTLTPAFSALVTEYTVTVANSVSSITLNATANDGNATVAGAGTKSLNVGANPFNIVVTAEDGTTTKTYKVTVSRENAPLSTDATLSGLTVSAGTLTPAFGTAVTEYTVAVVNSVSSITLNAIANHSNATVAGVGTKSLNVGANPFNIVVTAEDGTTTKTYKVTVTRENASLSTDATLASLTVSAGTLSPAFSSLKTEYTVTVVNSVSSVTLNATANHSNASVAGTGTKTLAEGENRFYIVVTAEDGTTKKTYTVTVVREKSDVGIEDVENAETRIYLNPAMNVLFVESPVPVQKLVVYNIHGAVALQQSSALTSIDVSALPQGIYIVKLITTQGVIVKKFAKR